MSEDTAAPYRRALAFPADPLAGGARVDGHNALLPKDIAAALRSVWRRLETLSRRFPACR